MALACETQEILVLRFPSRAQHLKEMRDSLRAVLQDRGVDGSLVDCMILAVNEACMNVIQHGYGVDRIGDIILQVSTEGDELVFHVTDFAEPADVSTIKSRDLEDVRPGGLGVYMIEEMMDEVRFLEPPPGTGNLLEMRKRLD